MQIPHVHTQLSTVFLAKHVWEISYYSGQWPVSISLKPGRARHQMGIDKETEERDRQNIHMHSKIKKKKRKGRRKRTSDRMQGLTPDGQPGIVLAPQSI